MEATTFLLLRHAAHDALGQVLCGRASDICLNATGRRQAESLAGRLGRERIQAICTSPVARARETAQRIAEATGLVPSVEEGLTEIDFGDWSGASFAALRDDPRWDRWNAARSSARPPAGESMAEAQRRVLAAMERLRGIHAGGQVALVSHGDVIKAALMHWLSMPLDAYAAFEIEPASLSRAVLWPGGAKVLTMNEVPA